MDLQVEHLYLRTDGLIRVMNILAGLNDENVHSFKKLESIVSTIKVRLDQLASVMEAKKSSINEAENLCEKLDYYQQYLEHLKSFSADLPDVPVDHFNEIESEKVSAEVSPCPQSWSQTLGTPLGARSNLKSVQHEEQQEENDCFIPHVSVQEVDSLHKYMRGRLTADSINSLVNVINSALMKKYTILKQKKSSLKNSEKDMHLDWKTLERNANIGAGQFYFTAEDIMALEGYKLDKNAYNIIVILRHTKRLKEMRFQSKLLYILT
ncbi:spindle and kinetochore-associated protein 1 homolog [Nilaparvata lugens]|uniref:spindle and kinetochore-associated protein 1 homolog n=1 Tax=Nilaparvata lugens TaxID=108931 RepID=UPI00193D142D|nr:spindle and kinetochore-associated protein 1 homolog [Nilaparvata lugens]XP_039276629.1 spindle and kinetochore-associated protein 1 homolog [Nilaparvata lugens]XP_039276630.1 spindle and kinetochore-associated protein 1 homolog [Nilaparvata lugens]XP_039276631.1 spindle and kinetochore-associated protein 1 homolog [Nilaparvata lugens]XP_039276632.1 spindle and kinetochore-associated protein 1 homolog [Nilaparvata lugens]XP_039276633.1 spindle and kinetochore-associated protein 1 homolog [N